CIPARRTWMCGQKPSSHGVFFNYNTELSGHTLPGTLAEAGYQCHLVGKLHLHPQRKLYGFHSMELADGPGDQRNLAVNDHARFLAREGVFLNDIGRSHGITGNSWHARPWHLPEYMHPTNWCISEAIDFLERRDPTKPFFLNVGIFHPHPPCTPPEFYYDRYINMDIPEPFDADWSRLYDEPQYGFPLNMAGTSRFRGMPEMVRQFRAAYFASIAHIDDQLERLLQVIPKDTAVIFASDHGEMLGDHQFFAKCVPYEPSARVPLIMRFPSSMGFQPGAVIDTAVELMDIMPTVLEAAGVPIPKTVDGQSLLGLLRGESIDRRYIHGECSRVAGVGSGMQYLTDGVEKYIWWPGLGREQFFNLRDDPRELNDLANEKSEMDRIGMWRERMTCELDGRPERFVEKGAIRTLGCPTRYCLPGFECDDHGQSVLHEDRKKCMALGKKG
ncbi:MAG: sulfatase-like hydrolase/transferase, partial [Victivallales bacterium]|nr:sulfatase-like hydrolase/transferase [Victivallales bacterium]